MGNVLGAAIGHDGGKFAELQVITQQMMQIRASQCTLSGAGTVLSPAGGQGQGQGQPRKSDQGSDLLAGLGVRGDGGGGEDAENADGGRLDQTLASTMLMTRECRYAFLRGCLTSFCDTSSCTELIWSSGRASVDHQQSWHCHWLFIDVYQSTRPTNIFVKRPAASSPYPICTACSAS